MSGPSEITKEVLRRLDPVITLMLETLGPVYTAFVIRGMCDRIEARARAAGQWDDAYYAKITRMDAIAQHIVRTGRTT